MTTEEEVLRLRVIEAREKISGTAAAAGFPIQHGVIIRRYRRELPGGESQCIYQNEGFSTQNFIRWKWYFRYLCAMEQTKTPRQAVEVHFYQYPHINPDSVRIKTLKGRLKSAKSKVTQFTIAIERAKSDWRQLFPIEETDEYKRALTKLQEKKDAVANLELEIKSIQA